MQLHNCISLNYLYVVSCLYGQMFKEIYTRFQRLSTPTIHAVVCCVRTMVGSMKFTRTRRTNEAASRMTSLLWIPQRPVTDSWKGAGFLSDEALLEVAKSALISCYLLGQVNLFLHIFHRGGLKSRTVVVASHDPSSYLVGVLYFILFFRDYTLPSSHYSMGT